MLVIVGGAAGSRLLSPNLRGTPGLFEGVAEQSERFHGSALPDAGVVEATLGVGDPAFVIRSWRECCAGLLASQSAREAFEGFSACEEHPADPGGLKAHAANASIGPPVDRREVEFSAATAGEQFGKLPERHDGGRTQIDHCADSHWRAEVNAHQDGATR